MSPLSDVFVITGPSGVGKGTLIRGLRERLPQLELSVSATTRAPRPGERDGVDYHFLSGERFDELVGAGQFVEHADYAGRRYGTLRSELEGRVERGVPVVLEIEVQGARQVRAAMPGAVQVFISPPSLEVLRERLQGAAPTTPRRSAGAWGWPSRSSPPSPSSPTWSSTTTWCGRPTSCTRSSPRGSPPSIPAGAHAAPPAAGAASCCG